MSEVSQVKKKRGRPSKQSSAAVSQPATKSKGGAPKGTRNNPKSVSNTHYDGQHKIRTAISNGLDRIKSGKKVGIDALADKIARSFEKDLLGTFKALAPYMPKDMKIDVNKVQKAIDLSDAELAAIIAERAAARREDSRQLEGEATVIEIK